MKSLILVSHVFSWIVVLQICLFASLHWVSKAWHELINITSLIYTCSLMSSLSSHWIPTGWNDYLNRSTWPLLRITYINIFWYFTLNIVEIIKNHNLSNNMNNTVYYNHCPCVYSCITLLVISLWLVHVISYKGIETIP